MSDIQKHGKVWERPEKKKFMLLLQQVCVQDSSVWLSFVVIWYAMCMFHHTDILKDSEEIITVQ